MMRAAPEVRARLCQHKGSWSRGEMCSTGAWALPSAPSLPQAGLLSSSRSGLAPGGQRNCRATRATTQHWQTTTLVGRQGETLSHGRPDLLLCSAGNPWEAAAPLLVLALEAQRDEDSDTGTMGSTTGGGPPAPQGPLLPPEPSQHTQLQLVNNLTSDCTAPSSEPVPRVGHAWSLGKG